MYPARLVVFIRGTHAMIRTHVHNCFSRQESEEGFVAVVRFNSVRIFPIFEGHVSECLSFVVRGYVLCACAHIHAFWDRERSSPRSLRVAGRRSRVPSPFHFRQSERLSIGPYLFTTVLHETSNSNKCSLKSMICITHNLR